MTFVDVALIAGTYLLTLGIAVWGWSREAA